MLNSKINELWNKIFRIKRELYEGKERKNNTESEGKRGVGTCVFVYGITPKVGVFQKKRKSYS